MLMRRRGPGLLGAMATTAVVAGTATAVSGAVQRNAQERAMAEQQQQQMYQAQQQAQMAPAPVAAPASAADDTMAQLQQLAALKAQGILTDVEFTAAKAKVLGL